MRIVILDKARDLVSAGDTVRAEGRSFASLRMTRRLRPWPY